MSGQKEYTIVGFGVAGCCLAWELLEMGIPFKVVDTDKYNSTRVAAGMMNPIVFRRLTKSWMVDDLFPVAKEFYSKVGGLIQDDVLIPSNIRRLFASVEEENNWSSLEGDDRFSAYLRESTDHPDHVWNEHGSGIVNTIGWLRTEAFLDGSKKYFESKGVQFEEGKFDYQIDDSEYIFCEGHQMINNPFFSWLRAKPAHGDVLTIRSKDLKVEEIINKKVFILPIGDDMYRVGATFNWKETEPVTTEEGLAELVEGLKKIISCDFEVVDQRAGLRPTVPDRRPYLGTHPEKKNLHIFNGLGTKGVMLAPYWAKQMADYLVNGKELSEEVNIARRLKWFNEFGA